MKTLGEYVLANRIKALVYGRSKVGKTFGAGTFPRCCWIDCDSGIGTLAGKDFTDKYGLKKDIIYEQFKEKNVDARGVPKSANAFDDACRFFDEMVKPANINKFDTWVVDTGTSLSEFVLNKAIVLLGGVYKGISSATHSEALKHGLVFPKIQDYGSERSMVEQFIGMVKDTDKNVLFLCHEKEIRDKDGDLIGITPLLTGKGVEAVSAMFDEVWNVRVKKQGAETIRYLQTQPDGVRQCGSRMGLPNGTVWSYDTIQAELEKIRNNKPQEKTA